MQEIPPSHRTEFPTAEKPRQRHRPERIRHQPGIVIRHPEQSLPSPRTRKQ
jgi:hypothetical protein